MKKTKTTKMYTADIYKLVSGDVIYHKGIKHVIDFITKNSQGTIRTITTQTHHLCGFDIFTTDKSKALVESIKKDYDKYATDLINIL